MLRIVWIPFEHNWMPSEHVWISFEHCMNTRTLSVNLFKFVLILFETILTLNMFEYFLHFVEFECIIPKHRNDICKHKWTKFIKNIVHEFHGSNNIISMYLLYVLYVNELFSLLASLESGIVLSLAVLYSYKSMCVFTYVNWLLPIV